MQNWIKHRAKGRRFWRFFLGLTVGALLLLGAGCGSADSSVGVGDWVDARKAIISATPGGKAGHALDASLALVISQGDDGWQQIIGVNGRLGWTRQALTGYGPAQITAKGDTLDYTSLPMQAQGDPAYEWRSLPAGVPLQLAGVAQESGPMTPVYLEQHGRSNLLPADHSPYQWPQLKLKWKGGEGWVSLFDLRLRAPASDKALPLTGLFVEPFLNLLPAHVLATQPQAGISVSNLALQTAPSMVLPKMKWTAQAAIALGAQPGMDLRYVVLLSDVEQESYTLVLHWQDHPPQYLAFSGWHEEEKYSIPTPVLMGYTLDASATVKRRSLRLKMAQIGGDDVRVERLVIDGAYRAQGPQLRFLAGK